MIQSPYCPDCPRRYHPIPGDGPQPADILVIGERPGANENKYHRVFIGKTGEELNQTYLPLAGLHREEIRVCNAVRCWADNNRTPTEKEIACCSAHHLPAEIESTNPNLIILMGGSACKMVPGIRLDTHHGFPQWGKLYDWEGWILPMYHPALGLHESRWMTQLLDDWREFHRRMKATLRASDRKYNTDYRLISDWRELSSYLQTDGDELTISCDTEDHGGVPWSIQLSSRPCSARLIRAADKDSIGFLKLWTSVNQRKASWIMHYAQHDLDVIQQMLNVEPTRYRDTMQEAYHLGNLPQGLKPLVYRLFGFTMTSWEDVVRPYSIEALQNWMVEALEIAQKDLSLIEVKRYKKPYKGKLVSEKVKKGPTETLLTRLITHTDVKSEYEPWERLKDYFSEAEYDYAHIEARIGKYPILGIANAPLSRAIEYACGDADWTLQAADKLASARQDNFWTIAESDADI